jgi:hypothetical protein
MLFATITPAAAAYADRLAERAADQHGSPDHEPDAGVYPPEQGSGQIDCR